MIGQLGLLSNNPLILKMPIPDYINCNLRKGRIVHCEYFMHDGCPETCAYAKDIRGVNAKQEEQPPLNIGGMDEETAKKIRPVGEIKRRLNKICEDQGGLKL